MTDKNYHCELAIAHFVTQIHAGKTRKAYRIHALLLQLWVMSGDMWAEQPTVHVAFSRLRALYEDRTHLRRALLRLAKAGAVKKGIRTRRGVEYTLCKPAVSELAPTVQDEIANMHPADYRRQRTPTVELVSTPAPKPKKSQDEHQAEARQAVEERRRERTVTTEYLKLLGLDWRQLARALDSMSGRKLGTTRYSKGVRETELFGAWLAARGVSRPELRGLITKIRKDDSPVKLEPDRLVFLFEQDTQAKRAYLASIWGTVRPQRIAGPTLEVVRDHTS